MDNANSIQIGGDHYKKREYQHWDWVCDTNLPYLLGCATKYISRWRNKNGVEDLRKAIHYIQKSMERKCGTHWGPGGDYHSKTLDFCEPLDKTERMAICQLVTGHPQAAMLLVEELISASE